MAASSRICPRELDICVAIALALIILVMIYANSFMTFNFFVINYNDPDNVDVHHDRLKKHTVPSGTVLEVPSKQGDHHGFSMPRAHKGNNVFRAKNKLKPEVLGLFNSTELSRRFDSRVEEFLNANQCKVQFFMTWFAPVDSFGEREFSGVESLFQTNPRSCLVIVSRTMDSRTGYKRFEPLITRGYHIRAITPDLWDLLKDTPGEFWLKEIENGTRDPGRIPLPQNLSNLMRLAVLYRYGGVYLDTDFIVLKDFSGLRNSIGVQSADANGNWTRLNNALLAFDKKHPLVYKFIEEFASTFDGNKWGHNGPYLVSRVVNTTAGRIQDFNFTIMPKPAFYPVDWMRISKYFVRPNNTDSEKWVESTIHELNQSTYAVHLWNSQSKKLKIEEGSIVWKLFARHCVICT